MQCYALCELRNDGGEMRDIPIIFSGPMVRALLDGRKTMTRRLAGTWRKVADPVQKGNRLQAFRQTSWTLVKPCDRLWVREAHDYASWDEDGDFVVRYSEDGTKSKWISPQDGDVSQDLMERLCGQFDKAGVPKDERGYYTTPAKPFGKPSIHMPRWTSRLTLIVTAVKTEKLQDMIPEDAIAEGMKGITKDGRLVKYGIPDRDGLPGTDNHGWPWEDWRISPVDAFERLWTNLHGADAWSENPDVVAITFTVHKQNIDALPKANAA